MVDALFHLGRDAVSVEQQSEAARELGILPVVEGIDILELAIEGVEEG